MRLSSEEKGDIETCLIRFTRKFARTSRGDERSWSLAEEERGVKIEGGGGGGGGGVITSKKEKKRNGEEVALLKRTAVSKEKGRAR